MQSLQKLRRYESLLIFLATTIYVVRRLFQEASGFDRMVTNAQQSRVPNYLIWRSLDNYNHVYNTIFPTIAGAIFLLAAWYIFHYYFYKKILYALPYHEAHHKYSQNLQGSYSIPWR